MLTRSLCVCALLAIGIAAAAGATTYPFICNLGYTVSTSGSGALNDTPRDRVCAVEVVFENSSGTGATTRTYSCTVAASASSCSYTIDPSASSVPAGWTPTAAVTGPLHSSTEESNGCVYLIVNAFSSPPTQYPTATILTGPMGGMTIDVIHYFDCTSVPTS
jgi:hypothetical protein